MKLELFKPELLLLQCVALVLSVLPIDGLMRCCSGCRVELVRLTALLALVSLVVVGGEMSLIVEVKLELFKFELPLLQCIALVLSVLPIDGLMRCCSGCRVELVRLTAL